METVTSNKRLDRKTELLRVLQAQESIALGDLGRILQISDSTLRRDLQEIIDTGYVRLSAGRVERVAVSGEEIPFTLREMLNKEEKKLIALSALELIQNGETIFISGGTTTYELACLLPGRRRLTVITNSLRVANKVVDCSGIELVILGGKIRPNEQTMHGHLTESAVQELRADKFFYGIPAIHPIHGLTHGQTIEVSTDRLMASAATQVIVLVDHTKVGKVAPALVLPISKLDTVITGREVSPEFIESLTLQNVKVLLV
jgi:DeoR/GlpR family transcriptional regulator of sugar metabolism